MNKNQYPLLFAGSSHAELAGDIVKELGIPLGKISLSEFPDGENKVEILEDVRGRDVFVLQSTGLSPSIYLMELLLIVDALKREAAKNIIAIIPYFGYSRQDRKDKPGVPITAKLIANMLSTAGITHLVTIDLHSSQIEGFFEIPVDHLRCQPLLAGEVLKVLGKKFIVVAPDLGSVKIVKKMANLVQAEFVVIEKQRLTSLEVKMNLIGNLSTNNVLLVDDMCSTGGTLVAAASLCKQLGAEKIMAAVTHGICSDNAIEKIERSPIDTLFLTNTLPAFDRFSASHKIKVVSIAPLLANAIKEWGDF